MKPRLKPVIKINESRGTISEWIVDKFPENYREMTYLEPFVGGGSVLLQKDPSVEEVINDSDPELIGSWRAIRDEYKTFVSKIKRIEHKEAIFKRYQKKQETDYLNVAVKDFVLRHMSKSGLKKTYLPKEKNVRCGDCWCDILDLVPDVSDRIKDVFVLNNDAMKIIRAFSHRDCLMYCDPPWSDMDVNKHVELSEALKEFRGKAIISAPNTALYRRLYAGWTRKGIPGDSKDSIWLNF
jgi:DNA adenine methylase